MLRTCCLLLFALLFQGCVYSLIKCHSANTLDISGYLDGNKELVAKYDLVYLLDGDTLPVSQYCYCGFDKARVENGEIRYFGNFFRNIFVNGSDFNCGLAMRGRHQVEIFLTEKISGESTLLAKKNVDMDSHPAALILTQVYFGNNRSLYKRRGYNNIEWGEMKQIVLENTNDTLYHHTAKYISYDVNERYSENMTEVIGD